MSLKYGAVMKGLYGEKVLEEYSDGIDKEWLDLERMEEEEKMSVGGSSFGGDFSDDDEEYGGYDDQYDDDEYDVSDYDSDDYD